MSGGEKVVGTISFQREPPMRVGVDYYPEHWPEERWPVDARLMREAGLSVVRLAEFAWCRMEPQEGRYTFDWLERAIAILHSEGIQVVLGTPTATPPAWLHERYPELYPADPRGYRKGFGTRLQRCLGNEVMRSYSRRITEAMVRRFADNPAVIGWQTDNEFEANLCYCDDCARRFREWLRRKYGTLEALNATWGTVFWSQEYSGWSQIPLPWEARCGQSHNPSLWLDYRRFASETTVAFQRDQIEIIRRLAPNHFVTHNFMGLHDSMDYVALAEDLDFVSWDNYPGGHWHPDRDPAMAHDVMRGIKEKNFWIMEEQCGIPGWERMGMRPAPGQIRMWAWQAIAHGADAVLFFRWRSCLYGTEQYWHGILNHDGIPRQRYHEIAGFASEVARLSEELDGSIVKSRVAILNSYEQNWALQIQPHIDGLGWWDQVRRFDNALGRRALGGDIVPITTDLASFQAVFVPSWYILTDEDAQRLAAYVKDGGTLVLNPRTGVKHADNTCRVEPLPGPLAEVAGIEVDDYSPIYPACPSPATTEGNGEGEGYLIRMADGREFAAKVWADYLTLKGAEAVATWEQGHFPGAPVVTRNSYGKGTCYYLGTIGEAEFYEAIVAIVVDELALPPLEGIPLGVDVRVRRKGEERYVFFINQTGEDQWVPLPPIVETLLGPSGTKEAALGPYDVAIYKLAPRT
ncbi:MAG: beta-galactosidase [Chthonomonadales bacterium]|nr:beta-galactosidase [Chthonomonadales bacterium]